LLETGDAKGEITEPSEISEQPSEPERGSPHGIYSEVPGEMSIANDLEFPLLIFKRRAFGWVVADTSLVRWRGILVYPAQKHGEPAGPIP
jgi:hypothetical protein